MSNEVKMTVRKVEGMTHNFELWAEMPSGEILGLGNYMLSESVEIAKDAASRLLSQLGYSVKE